MKTYADTGFLCSLYAPDANSPAAWRRHEKHPELLAFTWLHRLEFRNVMRLKVFRKQVSHSEAEVCHAALLADLNAGSLIHELPDMEAMVIESERLSSLYSSKLGTRSLDILHVAAALVIGSEQFLTFDKRQAALAKAAGMKTPAL